MPVPALVPCPQTSTVTPEEGRLLSESDRAPRAARLLENDERQFQTLTWVLTAEQSAAFRDWWRTDLIEGGAWFEAPETWPTPEGLVVKVRRFVGAPSWGYMGVGVWQVACDCEVRGGALLSAEEAVVYFLDTFTDADETPISEHSPDIEPNSDPYVLSGDAVGSILNNRFISSSSSVFYFTSRSLVPSIPLPYLMEFVFYVDADSEYHIAVGSQFSESYMELDGTLELYSSDYPDAIPLAAGLHTAALLVEVDGSTLTLDGVIHDKQSGVHVEIDSLFFACDSDPVSAYIDQIRITAG